MTAPYILQQAGRKVEPGSGGRHRLKANRTAPAAHGDPGGVEIGLWRRWFGWLLLSS